MILKRKTSVRRGQSFMKRNYYLKRGVIALLLTGGLIHQSYGQARRNTHFLPYSEVGGGIGTSSYYGELASYRQPIKATFLMMRWNAGINYTRHFTPKLAARASFTWARISGDDYTFNKSNPDKNPIQFTRNLHFRNDLKEFAITGIYQFKPDGRTPEQRPKINPYLFAGIALLAHSPQARTPYSPTNADSSRRWVKLQPLNTEGQGQPGMAKPYSLVTLSIPVGIGVKYALNESFNISFEAGFRYTFSDYLDDAGGAYAPAGQLSGLALQMSDRRNEVIAARKEQDRTAALQKIQPGSLPAETTRGTKGILPDSYLLTSLQLTYIIPVKIKCPPIR